MTKVEESLRQRLNRLLADVSMAEVSRATDTAYSNVNHYMRGRRVPAIFCEALVRNLGVNPSWILTGEGAPFLRDISGGTHEIQDDVSGLVRAMTSLLNTEYGGHTEAIGEDALGKLDLAMANYEGMRKKFRGHTRDLLQTMSEEIRERVGEGSEGPARQLATAAEQIANVCDDPERWAQYAGARAFFEYRFGDLDEAVILQRRAHYGNLAAGETPDSDLITSGRNYGVTLYQANRRNEAQRVYQSVLALMDGCVAPELEALRALAGGHDVMNGYATRGFRQLSEAAARLEKADRMMVRHLEVMAQFVCGQISVEDAITLGGANSGKDKFVSMRVSRALVLLGAPLGSIDIPSAEDVLASFPWKNGDQVLNDPTLRGLAELGAKNKLSSATRRVLELRAADGGVNGFRAYGVLAFEAAQKGDEEEVSQQHKAASRLLRGLEPGRAPAIQDLALYHSHGLKQGGRDKTNALNWFKTVIDRGANLFAPLLD